jgi:hypothetical protein
MGFGPYAAVGTVGFRDVGVETGAAWLIPTGPTAFVIEAGPGFRAGFGTSSFGVHGTVYWGSRSFNYHSDYGVSGGLFLSAFAGSAGEAVGTLGVQVDLAHLALPVVLLIEAVRH